MGMSNFWFYTIMIVVIGHVIAGFVYLMYLLSSKKKKDLDGNKDLEQN